MLQCECLCGPYTYFSTEKFSNMCYAFNTQTWVDAAWGVNSADKIFRFSFSETLLWNICLKRQQYFLNQMQRCSFQFPFWIRWHLWTSERKIQLILYLGFAPRHIFLDFVCLLITQQGKYCRLICLEHRGQCVILPALKLSWASSSHKVNTTRGMLMTITSALNFEPQRGN